MKYEIDLKNSFIDYITQTERKYFKIVYDSLVSDFYIQINRKIFILMPH